MMNHEIFAYKTLVSAILYLFWGCCFGNGGSTFLSYDYLGALWCKRNIFEKAAQLSVIVYDNKLNDSNDEKFVYFDRPHMHGIRVRDCEPSRIPKK